MAVRKGKRKSQGSSKRPTRRKSAQKSAKRKAPRILAEPKHLIYFCDSDGAWSCNKDPQKIGRGKVHLHAINVDVTFQFTDKIPFKKQINPVVIKAGEEYVDVVKPFTKSGNYPYKKPPFACGTSGAASRATPEMIVP
jgi:hypothetical protein